VCPVCASSSGLRRVRQPCSSPDTGVGGKCAFSEATVKTHLLSVYGKLGVSDRAAAVAEAFHRGLLVPGSPPA
jgi:ATP/maltotriose-dependent transcriptional regulator MalT